MFLQQVPNKPAGRGALLSQAVQLGLDRLWHLNQQPNHLHPHHPIFLYDKLYII